MRMLTDHCIAAPSLPGATAGLTTVTRKVRGKTPITMLKLVCVCSPHAYRVYIIIDSQAEAGERTLRPLQSCNQQLWSH
jgi:hypothetical protein